MRRFLSNQTAHQMAATRDEAHLPAEPPLEAQSSQSPRAEEQCLMNSLLGRRLRRMSLTHGHPEKRWSTDSHSPRQKEQFASPFQPNLQRLSFVRTLFLNTSHRKIFTFAGAFVDHTRSKAPSAMPPSCRKE